jgi:hypothetical protein
MQFEQGFTNDNPLMGASSVVSLLLSVCAEYDCGGGNDAHESLYGMYLATLDGPLVGPQGRRIGRWLGGHRQPGRRRTTDPGSDWCPGQYLHPDKNASSPSSGRRQTACRSKGCRRHACSG